MPCHRWLAFERSGRGLGSRCGVARKRRAITLHQDCPPWHPHDGQVEGGSDVRDRNRPTQAVPHRSSARRHRSTSRAGARQRGSLATRSAVAVRGAVRAAHLGGRSRPAVWARCSHSSSLRLANGSWMCRRRSRRGCGCSTRAGPTSPIHTTRVPRRSSHCATPGYGRSDPSTIPRCCACWRTVTTTSPRHGHGPSADSTPCSAS